MALEAALLHLIAALGAQPDDADHGVPQADDVKASSTPGEHRSAPAAETPAPESSGGHEPSFTKEALQQAWPKQISALLRPVAKGRIPTGRNHERGLRLCDAQAAGQCAAFAGEAPHTRGRGSAGRASRRASSRHCRISRVTCDDDLAFSAHGPAWLP